MRIPVLVAAVLAAAATIGITSSSARGSAITMNSERDTTRTFTVVERAVTDTVIDNGTTGDSIGDLLGFGNPIYTAANTVKVGNDQGSCVRTAVGRAWECSWTTILDRGSLVVQGPFYDAADSTLAIIGGTGAWKNARGEMKLHARNPSGSEYDFTFAVTSQS
jgi:allene oxide cyclase